MTACKDCRYQYVDSICLAPEVIKWSKLPASFDCTSGTINPAVAVRNEPKCSIINTGDCRHFKRKPTVEKDGFKHCLAHFFAGGSIYVKTPEDVESLPDWEDPRRYYK